MSKFTVTQSSPVALQEMQQLDAQKRKNSKYPWNDLQMGQSFTIKYDAVVLNRLQTLSYQKNAKAGYTKYRVYWHREIKQIEVARIA